MKQHIAIRAIIRKDEKTLLLRRSNGNPERIGQYELPGGRLEYGEQPEDALRRSLGVVISSEVQTLQLFDVLTYVDATRRGVQYVYLLYLVTLPGDVKITLSSHYNKYIWAKPYALDQNLLTSSTQLLLNISQRETSPVVEQNNTYDVIITSYNSHLIVYSDGGSRGNPGPSAAGFVVMDSDGHVRHEGGEYLGITTNNQAEYHGVRLGLECALSLGVKSVDFRIDSLLVVNQMNGIYKIKNRELWPIHERIRELVGRFDKVTFSHVKREFNQLADGMVNKILDAEATR
ncbi:MAG: reverse transcriptase-like protein [Candidatus Saccharimonadales bacterium]